MQLADLGVSIASRDAALGCMDECSQANPDAALHFVLVGAGKSCSFLSAQVGDASVAIHGFFYFNTSAIFSLTRLAWLGPACRPIPLNKSYLCLSRGGILF